MAADSSFRFPAEPALSTAQGSASTYLIFFGIAVVLLLLPIWTVSTLPWVDYGDHMARIFIERNYATTPVFQKYYQLEYQLFPNLAVDLVGPQLLRWFDLDTTSHVFASLSVLLFALGCHMFGKAVHGAPTWLAIPAAFFFYNSLLLYGFVNYMWGVALFLITAAVWLRFFQNPTLLRGAALSALALATYLAHLAGFFFLCSFIGLYVAADAIKRRKIELRQLTALVPLLPGFLAYAVFIRSDQGATGSIIWSTLPDKLRHSWVLFAGYSTWMDLAVACGLGVTLLLAWKYTEKVSLGVPLLIIAATYLVAFILFPDYLHTGSEADTRFLPVAALVALLGVSIRMPRFPARLVYGLLLMVSLFRLGAMTFYWYRADQVSRTQRALFLQIPENSPVYPMVFLPADRTASKVHQPLVHLLGYSTASRHVISGNTFAVKGQQPLGRRIPVWFHDTGLHPTLAAFDWGEIFAEYDFVWAYGAAQPIQDFLDRNCELVAQAEAGRLYHIRRQPPLNSAFPHHDGIGPDHPHLQRKPKY